jgi:hypothetical protein
MASTIRSFQGPTLNAGLLSHEGNLKKLAHTGRSRPWPFVIIHLPILLKESWEQNRQCAYSSGGVARVKRGGFYQHGFANLGSVSELISKKN